MEEETKNPIHRTASAILNHPIETPPNGKVQFPTVVKIIPQKVFKEFCKKKTMLLRINKVNYRIKCGNKKELKEIEIYKAKIKRLEAKIK